MSEYYPHVAVLLVSALVAMAVVWALRQWLPTSWARRQAVVSTASLVVGAVAGYLLGGGAESVVGGWPWGCLLGLAAGGGPLSRVAFEALRARVGRE